MYANHPSGGDFNFRKFSHINKLAQRLVISDTDEIPFNLPKKFTSKTGRGSEVKLTINKFKKKNINRVNSGSILLKSGIKNSGINSEEIEEDVVNNEKSFKSSTLGGKSLSIIHKKKNSSKEINLNIVKPKFVNKRFIEGQQINEENCGINVKESRKRKIDFKMIQFKNQANLKDAQPLRSKKIRINSARKPRIIIDASKAGKQNSLKIQKKKEYPTTSSKKPSKVGPFDQALQENAPEENKTAKKRLKLKNINVNKIGSLERYLKKIETMDEKPNLGYLNEVNNCSHTSKRSILMNQNHIYNNLPMFPRKSQANKQSARHTMDPNEEYIALKKLIDQIPDDEESGELLNPIKDISKFNHIYMSNVANPNGSEIAEELSNLGTERMSELTTEH